MSINFCSGLFISQLIIVFYLCIATLIMVLTFDGTIAIIYLLVAVSFLTHPLTHQKIVIIRWRWSWVILASNKDHFKGISLRNSLKNFRIFDFLKISASMSSQQRKFIVNILWKNLLTRKFLQKETVIQRKTKSSRHFLGLEGQEVKPTSSKKHHRPPTQKGL